jgi:hypothetical protein
MIEFSAVEVTIGKRAINKCHPNTITSGKITIDELTRLKFFEIHFFFAISGVLVGGIEEIGCHIEALVVVGAKLLISDGINTKRYFYVFLGEVRRLFFEIFFLKVGILFAALGSKVVAKAIQGVS